MSTGRMSDALREIEGWPPRSIGAFNLLGALLWQRVKNGDMTTEAAAKLIYALHSTDAAEVFGEAIYWIDEWFGPYMDPIEGDAAVRKLLKRFSDEDLPVR
jgi:hypothetical protein